MIGKLGYEYFATTNSLEEAGRYAVQVIFKEGGEAHIEQQISEDGDTEYIVYVKEARAKEPTP